jgi:cytochrome P450
MSMLPPDDLLSPAAIRDPQGFFRRLREHDPVFWSPRHKVFILTGHADVERAFQDRSMSTARGIGRFRERLNERHGELLKHAMALLDGWMLFNDPPTHARLRDPVRRAFAPTVADALVPRIEQHAAFLLDRLGPECDIVTEYAQPLTAMVICDLLGIDVHEREFLRGWARDFGRLIYGASSKSDDYLTAVARAGDAFYERFRRHLAARRDSAPETGRADDLLGKLAATSRDERWTEAELIGACAMLLFAGHDTTSALLGSSVRVLLNHPEALTALRDDPSRLPLAVEELLRFDGPSKTFIRVVTQTQTIGGHVIEEGQHLWLAILGANHDPAVFHDPDSLQIDRAPNPHIAFGAGVHFCLGSALARAEARVALQALLARFPALRLVDVEHQCSPTIVDRSLLALPVRLR